jgi:hypothetical protein
MRIILTDRMAGRVLGSCGSGQGQAAGCCEHGNELLDSTKCREFLGLHEQLLASQEGFCPMYLGLG